MKEEPTLRVMDDEDEGIYKDVASHRDLLAVQRIVESDEARIPDERAERLSRLGLVQSGELTDAGRGLYENMQEQRSGILERLRDGRVLSTADLRNNRGGAPGNVPLVRFKNAKEADDDVFMRAVVDWMSLHGELRYERDENRFVLVEER